MDDVLSVLETFFDGIWGLFTGVTIPGLNMTAAELFIALFVVGFSLRLISVVTGLGTNVASSAESMRTSHEKISQYRKAMEQNKKNSRGIGF